MDPGLDERTYERRHPLDGVTPSSLNYWIMSNSDNRFLWWEGTFMQHRARAEGQRLRIQDGYIIMRLWWWDSIRNQELRKVVRWWMPEVVRSRVPIRTRVEIEMAAFKKELMKEVSHIFN